MAKLTRDPARVIDHGPVEEWTLDVDGQNMNFVSFKATIDGAPLLKGLPNDECQCPHWGYVIKGEIGYKVNGVEETFKAGDAFYIPPGHTPSGAAGSEIVQFSPADQLAETAATMERNMKAMMHS